MSTVNIDEEIRELRGHFPDISRDDFYNLDTGNIGAVAQITTQGQYSLGTFEIILEFTPAYPEEPPNIWVESPDLDKSCGHVYYIQDGQAKICITAGGEWEPEYTSYDAIAMTKSWIFGYCKWEHTGEWGWEEASSIDYLLNT